MKRAELAVTASLILFLAFYISQDKLARAAWNQFHAANVSLVFSRKDARVPFTIGAYYFGGGEYDLEMAERAFRRAVGIDPNILWGHYQLSILNDFDTNATFRVESVA